MIELPNPTTYTLTGDSHIPVYLETHLYTADQLRTYGDQRAAEAREQMRDECLSLVGICPILRLTQFAWLTQRIKELK